jgi:hypothetical protein
MARMRSLRTIILTALASGSFGGGSSACDDCTETTFTDNDVFVVLESDAQPMVTTVFSGVSPSDAGASALAVEADPLTSTPFAIEAGGYDAWLASAAKSPCAQLCADLVAATGTAMASVTACEPATVVDRRLVVECAWVSTSCVGSSSASSDEYSGCSLGRGRLPPGFEAPTIEDRDPRARFFAMAAELEAASVGSFERLARDLRDYGAPARLVRAAMRARTDEVRHTAAMTALAHRAGARRNPRAMSPAWTRRTLEEIAIENAVEGCVRETYGALDAMWISRNAKDRRVRAVMRRIARDETDHATLAWSVAAWCTRRLSLASRRRVQDAHETAWGELAEEVRIAEPVDLLRAGLAPRVEERLALLGTMRRMLSEVTTVAVLRRVGHPKRMAASNPLAPATQRAGLSTSSAGVV